MAGVSLKQFFRFKAGDVVFADGRQYRITHVISLDTVMASDTVTGHAVRLAVDRLKPMHESDASLPATSPDADLNAYSVQDWQEAQRRFAIIAPLLNDANPRTNSIVARVAEENDVSNATLFRWLQAYREAGHVSALVPERRGRKTGQTMLNAVTEEVLQSVIDDIFLHTQRRSATEVIEEVNRRCRLARIDPPHPNTVRNRIAKIPERLRMKRRGFKEQAKNLFLPIRSAYTDAQHPFDVVQIDHTPCDIIVVDEVHRKPIGRPYITLAIDLYSRMIAGLYLSLEPPSAASVGLCLAQAMCPKREYLAALGVTGTWPVFGKIGTVHCDNAKEFRGKVLERGCQEYGTTLHFRPVKVPKYGGHIERLMGTLAGELHKLPGTTFSNTRERREYDSEATSALTLKELERWLVEFFVNIYHQRVHAGIGNPPLRQWSLGLIGDEHNAATGCLNVPADPGRITLDFMPIFERTVQQYGIQIDEVFYYDPVLDPYINSNNASNSARKRLFTIRRDPRDISKVYFFEPTDKRYCVIPYRNIGHPAMSVWELREVRRTLREVGRAAVDEHLIFETLDKMRAQVAQSTGKTKAARRLAQRNPLIHTGAQRSRLAEPAPVGVGIRSRASFEAVNIDADDPFAQPIVPFANRGLR